MRIMRCNVGHPEDEPPKDVLQFKTNCKYIYNTIKLRSGRKSKRERKDYQQVTRTS
ncbi:hypothetical protein GIB67_027557 [Kingdonia uniflora]|uniref:Uncharacterized protein n=1 Tax=Kingdonia uniflora TaxID=39325 RepID=A0A7J7NKL8_9MAGN|nr:hypothetical protein GIB67_027557 [Kingdonia uniflora]